MNDRVMPKHPDFLQTHKRGGHETKHVDVDKLFNTAGRNCSLGLKIFRCRSCGGRMGRWAGKHEQISRYEQGVHLGKDKPIRK